MWLGSFEEFPDYLTEGESLTELKENLRDLYRDLTSGKKAGIRRVTDSLLDEADRLDPPARNGWVPLNPTRRETRLVSRNPKTGTSQPVPEKSRSFSRNKFSASLRFIQSDPKRRT